MALSFLPGGGGTQSQTVSCQAVGSGLNAPSATMCTGTAPASQQACNTQACPPPPTVPPHVWIAGPASACSAVCGGGVQTYTPLCYRTDVTPNTVIPSANCADQTMPATQAPCNVQECPRYWAVGNFSACSEVCGPSGTQTRSVGCFTTLMNPLVDSPLADSACSTSKPASVQSCASVCPTWQYVGDWSACSVPCNAGVQTRGLICLNADGTPATSSAGCARSTPPPTSRVCTVQPCPHWHRNEWSQ